MKKSTTAMVLSMIAILVGAFTSHYLFNLLFNQGAVILESLKYSLFHFVVDSVMIFLIVYVIGRYLLD